MSELFGMNSTKIDGKTVVVEFTGSSRYASRERVAAFLNQLVENGCLNVVFALPTLTLLDAAIMSAMVGLYKKVKDSGGSVKMAEFSQRAQEAWDLAGLDEVFPPFATRAEALAAFENTSQS